MLDCLACFENKTALLDGIRSIRILSSTFFLLKESFWSRIYT